MIVIIIVEEEEEEGTTTITVVEEDYEMMEEVVETVVITTVGVVRVVEIVTGEAFNKVMDHRLLLQEDHRGVSNLFPQQPQQWLHPILLLLPLPLRRTTVVYPILQILCSRIL